MPKSIPIHRIEDYHTEYLGTCGEGLQYMGFAFFAESSQKRPIAVLHLLDSKGNHVESKIWESEKMYMAEGQLKQAVSELPNPIPGNINVSPFTIELHGLSIGLMPRLMVAH